MPTAPRRHRKNYNEPGHAHELTFSVYRNFPFFKSERACRWLSDSIQSARERLDFAVWAYVFMPEHVHLIVCPRQPVYDVAVIRRSIKEPVARVAMKYLRKNAPHWIPKLSRRRGSRVETHFWLSGGGYDRNITSAATLMKAIDYLHLNPVRRSLVERAAEFPWSSAAWYERGTAGPVPVDTVPSEWLDMESRS
jgi:putative transposase